MRKKIRKNKFHVFQDEKGKTFSMTTNELDKAINHLKMARKKVKDDRNNESCRSMRCAKQLESDIRLHCRQLPSVAFALRRAILTHNWKEAIVFTSLLCQPGTTRYAIVIVRACLILLFNHPKSNIDLLEKFIRSVTNYTTRAEIIKFIKILFCTREESLPVLGVGKYIRSSSQYRIVDDVTFKGL